MDFRVLIDLACLESIPKTKRRELVLQSCRDIGVLHCERGDIQMKDPQTHREFEVTVVAGYAITWWVDDPSKTGVIVDIGRVG